jgi:tetratricopeptide (TPR) repeat protein
VTLEVRAHGKDSWQEGIALDDLGIACAIAGKNEEALDLERRVVAIEEVELGPSHPYIASAENAMAGVLTNLGQLSAAEQHARRAVEIAEGTVNDEELARFVFDLGETLSAEKRLDDALSAYERAVVLAAKVHGGEPAMWDYFVRAGDTCRETGDATGAVPYLEGALALPEADGHADLTHVEFSLARALYDARLSPARALGLAVKARRTLAKGPQGEDTAKELAEIDAWISGKR